MSLSSLQSEVNRLERELSKALAYNQELRNELAIVTNGVSQAHSTLENYNSFIRNSLTNSENTMLSSHKRVIDAYEVQGEIERLYVRYKNMELANKKIRAANNKKYYDFNNYRTVRKIVQGIMDNLDVNMVSDQTVIKAIEVQHLQVPDFWLTCALISVMAWKNDDKELADRASSKAVLLDKKNSAVFYMLFNMRMQRNQAALKWFMLYKDCEQKGSDKRTFLMLFSMISKTTAENIDENTRSALSEYMHNVFIECAEMEGYSESDIVAMIRSNLTALRKPAQIDYAMLKNHCEAFGDLELNMRLVINNVNILQFIIDIVNVPVDQRNEFIKDYIDELIALPNPAEKSVYEEIAYNELVIKLEGDIDAAKQQFELEKERAESQINLASEVVGWIYDRGNVDINGQMRLNMFTLTKELQGKAIDDYTESYRSRRKDVLPVKIHEYAANVDFKNESKELAGISDYYTEIKNNALLTIKDWKAYIGFSIAGLALFGAFFAGFWLFTLTALGTGYGVYILLMNRVQRKQLELISADNIRNTTIAMSNMFTEYKQYNERFDEHDAYYLRIKNELSKL
jgi:hypothetical protein